MGTVDLIAVRTEVWGFSKAELPLTPPTPKAQQLKSSLSKQWSPHINSIRYVKDFQPHKEMPTAAHLNLYLQPQERIWAVRLIYLFESSSDLFAF